MKVLPAVKVVFPIVDDAMKYEGVAFEPATTTFTPINEPATPFTSGVHRACLKVPAKGMRRDGV